MYWVQYKVVDLMHLGKQEYIFAHKSYTLEALTIPLSGILTRGGVNNLSAVIFLICQRVV